MIVIPMDNRKQNTQAENELIILHNISPIKQSQIKSPRRYSVINEVPNKLPLILVEKVKIPRFLNSEESIAEQNEANLSGDTHNNNSFVDEISILYQNNNQRMNDKYLDIITEINRIADINFDVFKLSKYSNDMELFVLMNHLLRLYNFNETLGINKKYYKNYFWLINKSYRKNPYHNSIHGCDVTQTIYFLIKTCNVEVACNLTDLDIFSCFFASAIHDLDHPGNNNNYEIAVGSTLALSYNDKAVLENYHLCKAFSMLKKSECDVFTGFSLKDYNISRAIIINMVLSTDMANHFLDLALTKNRAKADDFNPSGSDKQLLLNQLIHASDISNPVKPMDIYREWVNRVFIEFYNQGYKERDQGLKISYLCDRHTVNIIDAQIGFIDNIVLPLYDTLLIAFPNLRMINNLILNNKEEFKKMKEKNEKIM
jgi:cAMP-specific phosphodiesterase 4